MKVKVLSIPSESLLYGPNLVGSGAAGAIQSTSHIVHGYDGYVHTVQNWRVAAQQFLHEQYGGIYPTGFTGMDAIIDEESGFVFGHVTSSE